MNKTEVYSWRVDPELKAELEAAARAEKTSVGAIIEKACRTLVEDARPEGNGMKEQDRLRKSLMKLAGSINGPGTSATNENVREAFQLKRLEDELRRRGPKSR